MTALSKQRAGSEKVRGCQDGGPVSWPWQLPLNFAWKRKPALDYSFISA